MLTVLIIVHVILAISLTGLILVQHGKGADAGAAFGSGASSTVFGARGAASFLTRTTAILATGFFVVSMSLAVISSRSTDISSGPDLGVVGAVQDVPLPAEAAEADAVTADIVLEDVPPLDEPVAEEEESDVPDLPDE
jgi:preprotein translocase subunit SecG